MGFFIVAVDANWGIAKEYRIPWHYKEDFAFFKEKTHNHACVMGYNTFAEIAQMRKYPEKNKILLPGRINYVITSKTDLNLNDDVQVYKSPESMTLFSFSLAWIGGKSIYDYAMDNYLGSVSTGYITRIKADHGCDLFFDKDKLFENFSMVEVVKETDDFTIERWERKNIVEWKNREEYKPYER